MANFSSLNAALPQNTNGRHDHNSFSEKQRPSFEYDSESRHQSRASLIRSRNSDTGASFPQPMPAPYGNGTHRESNVGGGRLPFDLGRSPPNATNKNTKHVPCKFFRQGTCQAGNACPFSHSLDPVTQTQPCKYFQKGTCKFGAKCALLHVYPDGSIASRTNGGMNMGRTGRGFSNSHRHPPPPFLNQDAQLSNSLLSQQRHYPAESYTNQYSYPEQDEGDALYDRFAPYRNGPTDGGFSSSPFGSPLEEAQFPRSPVENLRTALNAPLPQSFDPNGPSHIAKYGPLGQSVPDKFGMKSPPASLPKRGIQPPETSATLRGGLGSSNLRNGTALGSSPHTQDEPAGQRIMHSQKNARSNRLSASVPQGNPLDDWDENFTFEQDLLPNSVRDEVLTPQGRIRRVSRLGDQENISRDASGSLAIPSATSSKVGSPSMAGSPSRFRAIFEQQEKEKELQDNGNGSGNGNGNNFSAFGHVGSPLRESWMANGANASPGTHSGISQQMARMQLHRAESGEGNLNSNSTASSNAGRLHPMGGRHVSAPVGAFQRPGLASPGISSTRIDEEGEGLLLFSMDEWGSPRLGALDAVGTSTRPIDIREGVVGVGSGVGLDGGGVGGGSGKGGFGFR